MEARGGDGHVGDGNLPGADHLVPRHQPADRAVADVDQKAFVRHCRKSQDALGGVGDVDARQVQRGQLWLEPGHVAAHLRRLAKQQGHGDVDGAVAEQLVAEDQLLLFGRVADHGVRAAFALAECVEQRHGFGLDGEDVALLRLVAPDLQRRQAGLVVRHFAQLKLGPAPAVVDDFR